jgi:hypothetical protein
MSLVDDVTERLKAEVPAFQNRVEGAAELATLVAQKTLPPRTPASFVLPLGFGAAPNTVFTGAHSQRITERVGVVFLVRYAGDATGGKSLPSITVLEKAIEAALVGWQPASVETPLDVVRGALLSLTAGAVFYQLDFAGDRYTD